MNKIDQISKCKNVVFQENVTVVVFYCFLIKDLQCSIIKKIAGFKE